MLVPAWAQIEPHMRVIAQGLLDFRQVQRVAFALEVTLACSNTGRSNSAAR